MESLFPADRWQVRSQQLTALILALSAFLKDEGASRVLAACGARVSNDTVRRVIRQAAPGLCPPGLSRQNAAAYFPGPAGKVFPAGDPCHLVLSPTGLGFPAFGFLFLSEAGSWISPVNLPRIQSPVSFFSRRVSRVSASSACTPSKR